MSDNLNDIMNTPPAQKKIGMPKWMVVWIILAAIAVPGIAYVAYSNINGKDIGSISTTTSNDEKPLKKGWMKTKYGVYGLTVETPKAVPTGSLDLPDDVKKYIDRMDIFQSDTSNGLNIQIVSAKYAAIVGEGNLQGAADGAAAKMKAIDGVSDFNSTDEHVTKDSIPGIIQKGTYKYAGTTDFEFIDAMYLKGLLYWQVVIVYQGNDNASREIAQKVVNSIEIKIPQ